VSEIRLFDTDRAKATKLVSGLDKVVLAENVEHALRGAVGLVNATPIGMLPNRASPVPEPLLRDGLWVADAVYTPLWTPLLLAAKAKGLRVATGRDLAIFQAADAFELFTGLTPSAIEIGNAFDAVMATRRASAYGT
jgi:shikimate dehydrogenase